MPKIKRWFMNRLHTIMRHNGYESDWLETGVCEENNKWTPCDLIIREWLNNGGGSSKGFLGIPTSECRKCFYYICENKEDLIALNYISKDGWNNSGFTLWKNYDF